MTFQDIMGSAVSRIGAFKDLDTNQQMVAAIETVRLTVNDD